MIVSVLNVSDQTAGLVFRFSVVRTALPISFSRELDLGSASIS